MKVHILQHGLKDFHSHYYNETLEYVRALQWQHIDYEVYVHQACEPDIVNELGAHPIFRYATDLILDTDPLVSELAGFIYFSTGFAEDLQEHLTDHIASDDVIIVPYCTQNEVYGLSRWLKLLNGLTMPNIAVFVHRPEFGWALSEDRKEIQANASFWRLAVIELDRTLGDVKKPIYLCSNSMLARVMQKITGIPWINAGLVTASARKKKPTGVFKDIDVAFIGEFRPEKGSQIILDAFVKIDRQWPHLRYFIQTKNNRLTAEQFLKKHGFSGVVEFIEGDLTESQYFHHLWRCRLLVLPYVASRYALRASGVMSEAISFAIPVVVPANTWLADQVTGGVAAGRVFEAFTGESVAKATASAIHSLRALESDARVLAGSWNEKNNADSILKKILSAVSGMKSDTGSAR